MKPTDINIKIWRYMDFAKYVSLLDKQSLYFARADILAEKFDAFEGKYPNDFVIKILEQYNSDRERQHARRVLINADFQKMLIINCWHINDLESNQMWKAYADRRYGIAIQSTFDRLCQSFEVFRNNDVHIGMVSYDKDTIQFHNSFYPYVHKRPYFQHENELRAIILNVWHNYEKRIFNENYDSMIGKHVPIQLDVLIEKVVLAPKTPHWAHELINSVSKKYGMNNPIEPSKLDEIPLS